MPLDDIYWNSIDFGSEDESINDTQSMKHYVDPWDLENYAYIREQLDSGDGHSDEESSDEFTTEANSTSFSYVPVRSRERNYAAIEEVRRSYKQKPKKIPEEQIYYESDFEVNPYEVGPKDISSPYTYEQDRWRKPMNARNTRADRSLSFSYGDYGTNQDIYSKLDEIRPRRDATLPIYDDIRSRQPTNFGLSNYGHLKIDYSYSWNNLNKYICH